MKHVRLYINNIFIYIRIAFFSKGEDAEIGTRRKLLLKRRGAQKSPHSQQKTCPAYVRQRGGSTEMRSTVWRRSGSQCGSINIQPYTCYLDWSIGLLKEDELINVLVTDYTTILGLMFVGLLIRHAVHNMCIFHYFLRFYRMSAINWENNQQSLFAAYICLTLLRFF